MTATFVELGIPFPLFEAPVEVAYNYAGNGTCCICSSTNAPCFSLGIGAGIMTTCPNCGVLNGLDVDDGISVQCRNCAAWIDLPTTVATEKKPEICYVCLRAGKASLTKDTEFGMVSWEQAFTGVTHGVPDLRQDQFESVAVDPKGNWVGVKLSQDIMFELLRTPTYSTWQGERWLFCCRHPMTYVGEWHQDQFTRNARDGNGEDLYHAMADGAPANTWGSCPSIVAMSVAIRCRAPARGLTR